MEEMKQTMTESLDINVSTDHGAINHHVSFGLHQLYSARPCLFQHIFFPKCPQGIVLGGGGGWQGRKTQ